MNHLTNLQHQLLAGYVTGDLDPAEQVAFSLLITNHPELESEIAILERTFETVLNSFIDEDPPVNLREQLLTTYLTVKSRRLTGGN
ncbi:MAG: hypothetical protein HC924_18645 [Synechococcaceae cyanobacterium SM2_3_2]|nr:hypothetical protein [Synechococcaceae cyanobacterium SM2_3_2]